MLLCQNGPFCSSANRNCGSDEHQPLFLCLKGQDGCRKTKKATSNNRGDISLAPSSRASGSERGWCGHGVAMVWL